VPFRGSFTISRVEPLNSAHIGHSFGIATPNHLHFLDNLQCGYRKVIVLEDPIVAGSARTLVLHERAYRRSFADQVAIDFPSSRAASEFSAAITSILKGRVTARCDCLSKAAGAMVSLDAAHLRVFAAVAKCGAIGASRATAGAGTAVAAADRGGAGRRRDGDRFSFTLWLPRGPRTRVDVRVASP
jgi:hypothetical protein